MSRSAAGRTGGRAPGRHPERPGGRRTCPRRALLGSLATLALLAGPGIGTAAAAPGTAAPITGGGAPGDPTDPVRITVDHLDPRTVAPDSVIAIDGTLSNIGSSPIGDLSLRLQRGPVMTTRGQVLAADRDPDPDTAVLAPFSPLPGQLGAGDSIRFSYSLPAAALRLDQPGVYPVLLNLNGTVGGIGRRVGELSTFLVEPPTTPAGRIAVAWLWPLVDRPHRDASGHFVDDGLAREIGAGGRLDRLLTTLERLPTTTTAGAPSVPVTLAIDPALVEALQVMAAGPYTVGRAVAAGTGTQAAAAFLQRLQAVAAGQTVVALPYGDIDAEALQTAGLPDVIGRSLPGSATATARDGRPHPGPAPTTPPDGPAPPPPPAQGGVGGHLVASGTGARPRTDVDWLAGGPVSAATLATLRDGGIGTAILSAGALAGGNRARGLDGSPAAARTAIPLANGSMPALVADDELGALVAKDAVAGGPRIAEQRYLAELAVLGLQAGASPATVLVAPSREVDVDPAAADAMLADATGLPGLRTATLEDLAGGPATPTGGLVIGVPTASLDPTGMAEVAAAVAARNDLATAVVGDPAAVLAPYDAAISRTSSLEWRGDAPGFRAAAHDLAQTVGRLRNRVALVPPADGTYSLASDDAPLVLTVRNDLPFPVQVLLQLTTRGNEGLQLGDIGRQTLAPNSRTTLQVPTNVRRGGGFTVTAVLTTPDGRPLGDPVQIRVKSTAYGFISLAITIGAAALLGLLFLRRLVRFVVRRRRGPGPEEGPPGAAPEGAAVPLPPTRSPV